MNNQEIYPTPKDMISSKPPIVEPPATSKPHFLSIFMSESILFITSLVAVFMLSLILAMIFRDGLISRQGEYMGGLGDALSMMFVLPIPLIVFGILSLVTRNWTYVTYPLFAFSFSQTVLEWPIVDYLANLIPVSIPVGAKPGGGSLLEYIIAVQLTYILIHFTLHSAFRILTTMRDKDLTLEGKKPIFFANTIIFIVGNILYAILLIVGYPLLHQQLHERSLIRIPNQPTVAINQVTETGYQLYYSDKNNEYVDVGNVEAQELKKWWDTDTRNNCGSRLMYSGSPEILTVDYKKTEKGALYGMHILDDAGNKTYNYCFVAGNFKYNVERVDDELSNRYSSYPIGNIIDDIIDGEEFPSRCLSKEKECSYQDKKRVVLLKDKFDPDKIPKSSEWIAPGIKKIGGVQEYVKVGELVIPEWGVAVPLSEDIKGVSVGQYSQWENQQSVRIVSTNSTGQLCVIGNITRIKVEDIVTKYQAEKVKYPNQEPPYRSGVVVDNYLYSVGVWRGSANCATDQSMDGIFNWANVNLRKI